MAASSTALRGVSSLAGPATQRHIQPCRAHPVPRLQHCRQIQQRYLSYQLQQHEDYSRTAIVAAAGRRRRDPTGAAPPEDEPELDVDDVMFHQEGDGEDGEDELPLADDNEDDAERDWEEEVEDYQEDEDEQVEEVDEGGAEGEEETWDAALADFDTALDVPAAAAPAEEEAAAPSKEEQDRQKALAMVRFNEIDSEATIQVEEVPITQPWRQKTFDEQTALLSAEDKDTLTRNIQGYAVFPMEFVDLLVSELPDGRMILAECFIRDQFEDVYTRPNVDDDVSRTPRHYQLIPWEHTKTGDFLKRIDPVVTLQQMYFVAVANPSVANFQCDFSEIYSYDGKNDRFSAHKIKTLGDEPIKEPVMRIREDGIFIEDAWRVPGIAAVAEGFAGPPEHQYIDWGDEPFDLRQYVKMGLWAQPEDYDFNAGVDEEEQTLGPSRGMVEEDTPQGMEERLEELELMEEMDDMPDVPAVDMM